MPSSKPSYKSLTQLKAEIARLERIRDDAARKAATIEQQIREKSPRVRAAAAAAIGEAVLACVGAGKRQIDFAKLRAAAIELLPKRSHADARLMVESLLGHRLAETVDGDERDPSQDVVYRSGAVVSDSTAPNPQAASPDTVEIPVFALADASLGSQPKIGGHLATTTYEPRSAPRALRPGSYRPQS